MSKYIENTQGGGGGSGDGGVAVSAGTQSASTGTVVFSNSNGVTFGMSNRTITASVSPSVAIAGVIAGTQTATSGSVILSNSNGFTFGMSNSSVITGSYSQSTAPGALAAGTQTATSGTIVLSNSNGISFGMSGSTRITASYSQSTAPGAIQAGTQTATSGTVIFSNSNGLTFGMSNSSVITGSYTQSTSPGAIAAGTQTGTSGTIVLANSNGISFGMSGSSQITASISQLSGDYFDNMSGQSATAVAAFASANGVTRLYIAPLNFGTFPFNMTANTAMLQLSLSDAATSVLSSAFSSTIYMALYTGTSNTLAAINSVAATFGQTANTDNSNSIVGVRFLSINSSQWSSAPVFSRGVQYYLGFGISSAGTVLGTGNLLGQFYPGQSNNWGTIGQAATNSNNTFGNHPWVGQVSSISNTTASINISDVQIKRLDGIRGFVPRLVLVNNAGSSVF